MIVRYVDNLNNEVHSTEHPGTQKYIRCEDISHALDHVLSDLDISEETDVYGIVDRIKSATEQLKYIQKGFLDEQERRD